MYIWIDSVQCYLFSFILIQSQNAEQITKSHQQNDKLFYVFIYLAVNQIFAIRSFVDTHISYLQRPSRAINLILVLLIEPITLSLSLCDKNRLNLIHSRNVKKFVGIWTMNTAVSFSQSKKYCVTNSSNVCRLVVAIESNAFGQGKKRANWNETKRLSVVDMSRQEITHFSFHILSANDICIHREYTNINFNLLSAHFVC